MSKYTEALNEITKYQVELEYTMQGTDKWRNAMWTCKEALEIADRVSQIDYMEMPTPKITETDNGVKANANILEAVEVITHNNLLAKIKGEEERIYAK